MAHVAGSRGLGRAVATTSGGLPAPPRGACRVATSARSVCSGALYSVGGDRLVEDVVASLDGRAHSTLRTTSASSITRPRASRRIISSRCWATCAPRRGGRTLAGGLLPLAQQALDDVDSMGVDAALTGPASRADMATIDAHLEALPESERSTYVALANAAFELAEKRRATQASSVLELTDIEEWRSFATPISEPGLVRRAACRRWARCTPATCRSFDAAKRTERRRPGRDDLREPPSVRPTR